MKFVSICLFIVVATAAAVSAARPSKPHQKVAGSDYLHENSHQMMSDSADASSPDAKDNSALDEGPPAKRGRGRGRKRNQITDSHMTSTTSTTPMPTTSAHERHNQTMHDSERPGDKKGSDEMMSMSMPSSTTTKMPMMIQSSTTPKHEMDMFPDLGTVEQLQKKQAEEHEKIIAVYKSFKDWVDYLRNSIKGGTLNPVLTRRILEDIRAYQQVIMSPHLHKPYTPPHPCDPLRDVWCPEKVVSTLTHHRYNTLRRKEYEPSSNLVIM